VALLLSLLVHATLFGVLVLGIAPTDFLGTGAAVLPPSQPLGNSPSELQVVHLGLEDSDADTRTWIGYRDFQEQFAPRSEVEQAAFEEDPMGGAAGMTPEAEAPETSAGTPAMSPPPEQAAEPPPAEPAPTSPQPPTATQPAATQPAATQPAATQPAATLPAATLPADPAALDPLTVPKDQVPPQPPPLESTPLQPDRPVHAEQADLQPALPDAEATDTIPDVPLDEPPVAPRSIEELAQFVESLLPSRQILERWVPAPRESTPSEEPPPPPAPDTTDPNPSDPRDPTLPPVPATALPTPPPPQPAASDQPSGNAPSPPSASAPGPPRQSRADGEPSDRQSDATSIVDVPPEQWRRGRPLAARGLDIKTRRPVFPELTSLTARPGNPIVEILFDRTGVPRKANVLRSSGDARVDGPLLDALYRWRASGEALKRLEEGELFRIEMRILLGE